MVSSSSTKKAARLAQKGKGKKVRFQGGTLFPMLVLAILVIGLGTIVYARPACRPPTPRRRPINDHWHVAYGFDLCDTEEFVKLDGALEETDANGQLVNNDFLRTGVHSHDDGVIHWHAYTSAAVGKRATLGVFLDNYGVELDRRLAEVPGEPERRQGVHRGRDEVRRRQGRRAVGHRVGQPVGHQRRPPLRLRLRRHPHRQGRHGLHDRLRAPRHHGHPAAVGRRPGRARRRRHGPGRPDDHACPAAPRRRPSPRRTPGRPAPARSSAPPTPSPRRRRPTVAPTTTGG